jgi:hypothetical protein
MHKQGKILMPVPMLVKAMPVRCVPCCAAGDSGIMSSGRLDKAGKQGWMCLCSVRWEFPAVSEVSSVAYIHQDAG